MAVLAVTPPGAAPIVSSTGFVRGPRAMGARVAPRGRCVQAASRIAPPTASGRLTARLAADARNPREDADPALLEPPVAGRLPAPGRGGRGRPAARLEPGPDVGRELAVGEVTPQLVPAPDQLEPGPSGQRGQAATGVRVAAGDAAQLAVAGERAGHVRRPGLDPRPAPVGGAER